jgi:hypothetical protein
LNRAIATTLADQLVDEDAFVGIRVLATFAATPFLRGARLIIDQYREPGNFAKLPLHRIEQIPVTDFDAGRQAGLPLILLRLVRDDDDPPGALGGHLPGDQGHGEFAVVALTAGHGHRVIEQDLVGDVHAGRGGGANGQQARVHVGSVA